MDEEYLLTTPENVPITYELAGLGSRFVASLLDSLIIALVEAGLLIIAALAGAFSAATRPGVFPTWIVAVILLIAFGVGLGYPLLFDIIWSGQTPGKRKTGIRMIQDSGAPLTATAAIIRNVMRMVDILPAYYIIGTVAMLIDRKGRRLGDLAAGTICVKERRELAADRVLSRASAYGRRKTWSAVIPADGLARLTHEDLHLVNEYLLRRDKLAPGPAQSLASRIADRIAPKLGIGLNGQPADEFLERVALELEQLGDSQAAGQPR